MKAWLSGLAATLALTLTGAAPQSLAAQDASLEAAVLAEINLARTHPAEYAERLRRFRAYYHGKLVREPGVPIDVETYEGVAAVDEAIAYVRRQRPMAPLGENERLDQSAMDFADRAGPAGIMGHVGPDGSTVIQRIRDTGLWPMSAAEDIAYGPDTAVAVVRGLIIDDGVPSRGHRSAIFDPGYQVAGVGCGPHRVYHIMCVIDFAGPMLQR